MCVILVQKNQFVQYEMQERAGIRVTAEVSPHHLLLSEEDIPVKIQNCKMNPPFEEKDDREALIEGLLDGTIDFIATDHAPHTAEEKVQVWKACTIWHCWFGNCFSTFI